MKNISFEAISKVNGGKYARATNLTLEEARRFDFLEGLRLHNYSKHVPAVLDHYSRSVAAAEAIGEARPGGPGEASRFIEHDPLYQFAAGIQRHAAVMGWSAAIESLRPYVDRLRGSRFGIAAA